MFRPKPPSVENKRPTKSFDPFDFGAFKSRPMVNGTAPPPQPQNNQRPVQRRPDPFADTAFRQPPPVSFFAFILKVFKDMSSSRTISTKQIEWICSSEP